MPSGRVIFIAMVIIVSAILFAGLAVIHAALIGAFFPNVIAPWSRFLVGVIILGIGAYGVWHTLSLRNYLWK